MGRAIIGESAKDKAIDRMDKFIRRSNARGEKAAKEPSLAQQIKNMYGSGWRSEVEEMAREANDPEYAEKKREARDKFKAEYNASVPRWEKTDAGEKKFVDARMREWVLANAGS